MNKGKKYIMSPPLSTPASKAAIVLEDSIADGFEVSKHNLVYMLFHLKV